MFEVRSNGGSGQHQIEKTTSVKEHKRKRHDFDPSTFEKIVFAIKDWYT